MKTEKKYGECSGASTMEALPPQLDDYSRDVSTFLLYILLYATISFWLGKCCYLWMSQQVTSRTDCIVFDGKTAGSQVCGHN